MLDKKTLSQIAEQLNKKPPAATRRGARLAGRKATRDHIKDRPLINLNTDCCIYLEREQAKL